MSDWTLSSDKAATGDPTQRVFLFEVSHEVAKKSGGIYTVISSKSMLSVMEYGDRYALVGPYSPATAAIEFEELVPSQWVQAFLDKLRAKGVIAHFGRWLVKGSPRCFLLETKASAANLATWRADLQGAVANEFDTEANDAIVFGYQCAHFFQELEAIAGERKIVAHFHEWLASVGLIVMRKWGVKIPTLFTTHATLLGRYIAAGGMDLYASLHQGVNPDSEAGTRQIYNRHWIEVGAARGADVFTTVSDITNYEAQCLLGREADVVTPNGLNTEKFTAMHEFQNLHKRYKDVIAEFCRGHFFGNYDFDLDNTLFFFTAGRREYRNKGVDLMIEALADLNYQLKRDVSKVTVVAFIIMPGAHQSYNVESIKGQSVRRQIRETCHDITKRIAERMYEEILHGRVPTSDKLLGEEDVIMLKRRVLLATQSPRLPPVVTHNMVNDAEDEILCHVRRCSLFNNHEDRVKIIYHPEFLSATSPILPLDYSDFVRGCHLGVFVSYYEPWGYTPAECALSGVPSITSNLTGFANYMQRRLTSPEDHGIYIIDRRNKSFHDSKDQLAGAMWRFCQMNRRQRIEQRNKTERLSDILSWDVMYKHYVKARNLALKRAYGFELPMPTFIQDDK
jgi:glycogen(starch) synthase